MTKSPNDPSLANSSRASRPVLRCAPHSPRRPCAVAELGSLVTSHDIPITRFAALLLAVIVCIFPSAVCAYDDTLLFTSYGNKELIEFRTPTGHLRKMSAWDPLTQAPPVPLTAIIAAAISAYVADTKTKPEDWKFVDVHLSKCSSARDRWYYTVQLYATEGNPDRDNLKIVAVLHDGTTVLGRHSKTK